MRQVAAAGRHWVRCVAVLSIALCHFLLAADSGGSREIPVTGIYLNSEYGYSVRIPENLHASRLAAPAPNQGFGKTQRKEPESYIWTNGEYDALMIEDLDVLAHEEASALGDQGMKIVKITKSTLGGAQARSRDRLTTAVEYIRAGRMTRVAILLSQDCVKTSRF